MNVLVACEESGTVREAFRKLDHNAWSNDLIPCSDDSTHHLEMDCFDAIFYPAAPDVKWDLIPTDVLVPPAPGTQEYLDWQKVWRMPPSPERKRLRSVTYQGIADAMAEQWGSL